MKKTYIARGLIEYQMWLNIDGLSLRICFSGGSMSANGVVAARYTTDNPLIQHFIEKSQQFATHRIALLR